MKLHAIFAAFLGAATTLTTAMDLPTEIDMDVKIQFEFCRQYGDRKTCDRKKLEHGRCYDFEILSPYLNDNIRKISIKDGRCVIWEKNGCHGDHTAMIVGANIAVNNLCPKYDWERRGSSIKCCGGDPSAQWCADPGLIPMCTD